MAETAEGRVKRRRSKEEVSALVAEFRASGLSRREFAEQSGIPISTVHSWLRNRERSTISSASAFVPVSVRTDTQEAQSSQLRVELSTGRVVTIPSSFPVADLARLLDVLDARC